MEGHQRQGNTQNEKRLSLRCHARLISHLSMCFIFAFQFSCHRTLFVFLQRSLRSPAHCLARCWLQADKTRTCEMRCVFWRSSVGMEFPVRTRYVCVCNPSRRYLNHYMIFVLHITDEWFRTRRIGPRNRCTQPSVAEVVMAGCRHVFPRATVRRPWNLCAITVVLFARQRGCVRGSFCSRLE